MNLDANSCCPGWCRVPVFQKVSVTVLDEAQGQINPFDMEYKHVLSVHVSNTCTSNFSHATDAHIPLELFDSAEERL